MGGGGGAGVVSIGHTRPSFVPAGTPSSVPNQGLQMCPCSSPTFSFRLEGESFRVSEAGRAELWWGHCSAGRC